MKKVKVVKIVYQGHNDIYDALYDLLTFESPYSIRVGVIDGKIYAPDEPYHGLELQVGMELPIKED